MDADEWETVSRQAAFMACCGTWTPDAPDPETYMTLTETHQCEGMAAA